MDNSLSSGNCFKIFIKSAEDSFEIEKYSDLESVAELSVFLVFTVTYVQPY